VSEEKIWPNPVGDAHLAAFRRYIIIWQAKLNLQDWRIIESKARSKSMAEVTRELAPRLARWKLGTHFGQEPVTSYTLEATALHELLHILLKELIEVARSDHCAEDIESAEHRVINTLEKLLLPAPTSAQRKR
jgi:hypothetical protein